MLRAVTEEISTATAELALTLRNLRLTQAQASKLARTLTELAEGLRDAGDGEPRYGLLLSLYRPWQASPAPGETASG